MLSGVVADAVPAGHEHHAGRTDPGKHLGIVAGARRHPVDRVAEAFGGGRHDVDDPFVKDDRLEAGQRSIGDLDALGCGEVVDEAGEVGLGPLEE